MATEFKFDVFLSHSSKDKPVVRELAARLQKDGIRVWLDEKQIKPGESQFRGQYCGGYAQ